MSIAPKRCDVNLAIITGSPISTMFNSPSRSEPTRRVMVQTLPLNQCTVGTVEQAYSMVGTISAHASYSTTENSLIIRLGELYA